MREILFRGKRIDNGEWVYGEFVTSSLKMSFIILQGEYGNFEPVDYEVDPATIGQYTCLTDKTGVKIFEGDILKTNVGCCFAVEWDADNGRFLGFTFGSDRRIIYVGRVPKAEIIGNIHDNPELLEGGDEG